MNDDARPQITISFHFITHTSSFASYFWAYDFLKRKLAETSGAPSEAMWIALVAGGLSGIAACRSSHALVKICSSTTSHTSTSTLQGSHAFPKTPSKPASNAARLLFPSRHVPANSTARQGGVPSGRVSRPPLCARYPPTALPFSRMN